MHWEEKLKIVQQFYNQKEKLKTGIIKYGKIIPHGEGFIDKMPEKFSGVWGYGGDSIAVYVNGNPYPSETIIKLNK